MLVLLLSFRIAVWFKNRQFNKLMIPTGRKMLVVVAKQTVFPETVSERQGVTRKGWVDHEP
jgi:hypothetical protein